VSARRGTLRPRDARAIASVSRIVAGREGSFGPPARALPAAVRRRRGGPGPGRARRPRVVQWTRSASGQAKLAAALWQCDGQRGRSRLNRRRRAAAPAVAARPGHAIGWEYASPRLSTEMANSRASS
jgi:hypothetical protein